MSAPAFDVIDALGGLAGLVKRTPTLDGAVPVRVAQGCSPMLEGNAFGFQVVLRRALVVRARWATVDVTWASADDGADLARRARAVIPRLVAEGLLPSGGWSTTLARAIAWTRAGVVRVWTGLLVRPRHGVWLRVSGCANRRNRLVAVEPACIAEERYVPLVVDMKIGTRGPIRLEGEIACVAPLAPDAGIDVCELADAPEIGRAHAEFYDRAYFETKKRRVGAKYRNLLKRKYENGLTFTAARPSPAPAARCRMVRSGPARFEVGAPARFFGPDAPAPSRTPPSGGALPILVHRNAISFRARFDGHTLVVEKDARALAEAARAVERVFEEAYGGAFVDQHRGALWYLTKYFTPHPPGEPHFFVKPWAFTATPPGWSTLVDGIAGDGYDVLRGVVATDVFHATPAVFALHDTGRWIDVPAGTPLLETIPFPRSFAQRTYHEVRWP